MSTTETGKSDRITLLIAAGIGAAATLIAAAIGLASGNVQVTTSPAPTVTEFRTIAPAAPVLSSSPAATAEVGQTSSTIDQVSSTIDPTSSEMENFVSAGNWHVQDQIPINGKTANVGWTTMGELQSKMTITLNGNYKTFTAVFGATSDSNASQTGQISVSVDGKSAWRGSVSYKKSSKRTINVTGAVQLQISIAFTNGPYFVYAIGDPMLTPMGST